MFGLYRLGKMLNIIVIRYLICVNLQWKEAVDPYTVSVTANGTEGVIIDLNKTKIPKRELPPLESAVDSIIYETHIRDFTIHPNSGVTQKGTYNGAAQLNTKGIDAKSNLSFLCEGFRDYPFRISTIT